MKHKFALPALFAVSLTGYAHAIGQVSVVWHQALTGPSSYTLHDAATMPNGDIVYVGEVQNANDDLYVSRQDINGNTIWVRTFAKPGPAGDVFAQAVRISPLNNNIYIACEVTGNVTLRDFWLVELDPTGAPVANRMVDHFNNDKVGDFEIGVQGNLFLGAMDLTPAQPLLVKMDPAFNTMFTYTFGNPAATAVQRIEDIEVSPTGDVLIAGGVHDGTQSDVGLDRIDFLGVAIYQKVIGDATLPDGGAHIVDAADGSTYLGYIRKYLTIDALGRFAKFNATGVFQWNFDSVGIEHSEVAQMVSGDIVFAGSADGQGYETRVFRLTDAGVQKWSSIVAQPDLSRNLLDGLVLDADGTIFTYSHVEVISTSGADWDLNCFMPNGFQLYQTRWDTGASNTDLPTCLTPVGNKGSIVGGYKSAFGDSDIHLFRLSPVLNLYPSSATLRLGRLNSGDVNSLSSNDNNYYEACKFIVPNVTTPPVNIEFDATIPPDYPVNDLNFGVTSKANTPGLQQNTELWNWTVGAWQSSTLTGLSTSEVLTTVDGDPALHVEAVTLKVRARIRVRVVGPVVISLWCVQVDQAGWRVIP